MVDDMTESEFCYAEEFRRIEDAIKPLLTGHPPPLQGAILADLLALYLAGHAPDLREDILQITINTIRRLIPVNEANLFGPDGHPYGRKMQ